MHGERIDHGAGFATYRLIDASDDRPVTPWVDVRGCRAFSVEVQGLQGGAVVLRGSNQREPRADEPGHQMGGRITSDGLVMVTGTVAWIRATAERNQGPVSVTAHAAV